MPMTCGVFRPAILLPAGHDDWPAERLRLVRAHELVHVQQRDCLFQIVMQIACALHWFHPLVWLAAAQFRMERERACDDGVLRARHQRSGVCGTLAGAGPDAEARRDSGAGGRDGAPIASREQAGCAAGCEDQSEQGKPEGCARDHPGRGLPSVPLAAVRGQAQGARGTISGVVYDASGAVIPNATVLATNLDANSKEAAITSDAGEYSLASIPGRALQLEVSSPGFKIHRNNVTLNRERSTALGYHHGARQYQRESGSHRQEAGRSGWRTLPFRSAFALAVTWLRRSSSPKSRPSIPRYAQEKGIEGPVLLEAVISTEGNILSLKAVNYRRSGSRAPRL